jgi:hypothetical protein
MDRIEFPRIGRAWGFKIAVYMIILPGAAALAGILLTCGVFFAIGEERFKAWQIPEWTPFLIAPAVLIAVGILAARDGRWRFPSHLALEGGRVEWGRGRRRYVAGPGDILGLRLSSGECGLATRDGRGFSLRPEEWDVAKIREALQVRILPGVIQDVRARLAAGETLRYRTPLRPALLALAAALILGFLGCILTVAAVQGLRKTGATHPGILILVLGLGGAAAGLFRRFLRIAGHEVAFDASGLRVSRFFRAARLEWGAIRGCVEDAEGLRIDGEPGRALRIEDSLTGYGVLGALVRAEPRDRDVATPGRPRRGPVPLPRRPPTRRPAGPPPGVPGDRRRSPGTHPPARCRRGGNSRTDRRSDRRCPTPGRRSPPGAAPRPGPAAPTPSRRPR